MAFTILFYFYASKFVIPLIKSFKGRATTFIIISLPSSSA